MIDPDFLPPRQSLAERALRWRPAIDRRMAAILSLAVAILLLALVAWLDAHRLSRDIARQRADTPAVIPTAAPAEPLGATIAAIARALPEGATVAALSRDPHLSAVIETPEPDRLRAALAADPALVRLRTVGEAALPDGGYRVTLEERQ